MAGLDPAIHLAIGSFKKYWHHWTLGKQADYYSRGQGGLGDGD
jgi:hypothetical protein